MKRQIACFLIVLLLLLPCVAYPYSSSYGKRAVDYQSVCTEAKNDASAGSNWLLWAGGGCAASILSSGSLGLLIILCGYLVTPSVPPDRLLGKSSDYVVTYTGCYQDQAKTNNGNAALTGCVSGVVLELAVVAVFYLYVFNYAYGSASYYYY